MRSVSLIVVLFVFSLLRVNCPGQAGRTQDTYETPPVLRATDFMSPEMMIGMNHTVGEIVQTQGFANTYTLTTAQGTVGVSGTSILMVRIREANALAEIERIKGTKQFADAVGKAAKSPLAGAKSLITKPIQTVGSIPKGAKRIFQRVGEKLRGRERSEYEDRMFKSAIGFSKVKRRLAYDLKIDPYTSNKKLQEELNGLAWAEYAGKMGVTAGLTVAGGGVALMTVRGLKKADDFAAMIRDFSPSDLQLANRKRLEQMGVTKEVYQPFIDNVWYSPTTESAVVMFLDRLGAGTGGRSSFIRAAAAAKSEFEANHYLQIARLLALYQQNVGLIGGITQFHGSPVAFDGKGTLIVPLHWDYAAWTKQVAASVDGMRTFSVGGKPVTGVNIFLSGRFSPRARREVAARGVRVTENLFGP